MRGWKGVASAVAAAILCVVFFRQIRLAGGLMLGGALTAYLIEPMAGRLAKRMRRGAAVLTSVAAVLAGLAATLLLIVPPLVRQIAEFMRIAPALWGLFGGMLPVKDWAGAVIGGTAALAGCVGQVVTAATLGVFFALDRERLLLKAEMWIPSGARKLALRMAGAVDRELRGYLRGQVFVSLIVGALAALGFFLAGLPSALLLGLCVAVFNLIPYFGPYIGAAPAVLLALEQGWQRALTACAVAVAVQQMDGMWISPRMLSGVTGLRPASVLLAISIGASLAGVVGMLLALPALICVKTCLRVWAGRKDFPKST